MGMTRERRANCRVGRFRDAVRGGPAVGHDLVVPAQKPGQLVVIEGQNIEVEVRALQVRNLNAQLIEVPLCQLGGLECCRSPA